MQPHLAASFSDRRTDYLLKGMPGSRGYASGGALTVTDLPGEATVTRGTVLVVRFPVAVFATLLNQGRPTRIRTIRNLGFRFQG